MASHKHLINSVFNETKSSKFRTQKDGMGSICFDNGPIRFACNKWLAKIKSQKRWFYGILFLMLSVVKWWGKLATSFLLGINLCIKSFKSENLQQGNYFKIDSKLWWENFPMVTLIAISLFRSNFQSLSQSIAFYLTEIAVLATENRHINFHLLYK